MLLNTELAVDFTEFQAVESEDLMLLHFGQFHHGAGIFLLA